MAGKKHSLKFWIRLASGVTLFILAAVLTISFMVPSWLSYKKYYDQLKAEREHQKYLDGLPLEFLGISAQLAEGVEFYTENFSPDPIEEDFEVKANFTEKGRDFSKKLTANEYTIDVPEDFAANGGVVTVSYTYTPEKGADGEEAQPITKTADVNISLVVPDETVYKIIAEPTFKQDGTAVNINGDQVTLTALNNTDYDYTEKNGVGTFKHNDYGTVIRKRITESISLYDKNNKVYNYNNLDCHFSTDFEGLSISYDGGFVLTAAAGKTVTLGKLSTDYAVAFEGSLNISGANNTTVFAANVIKVKNGAVVDVTGAIQTKNLLVEEGGTLKVTANADAIVLEGATGIAQLNGTVTLKHLEAKKQTGINIATANKVIIGETCKMTADNFDYAIGQFNTSNGPSATAYLYIPEAATQNGNNITLGDKNLVESTGGTALKNGRAEIVKYGNYMLFKAPTSTETGIAVHSKTGAEYELPVLNFEDYSVTVKAGALSFKHGETSVLFDVTSAQIGGLTVEYSAENGLTLTAASGTAVAFEGIEGEIGKVNLSGKVTFAGEGTFVITGANNKINLAATDISVKQGATVEVTGIISTEHLLVEEGATLKASANADVVRIEIGTGTGTALLYGTVVITKIGSKASTGLNVAAGTKVVLGENCSFTAENLTCAIGEYIGTNGDAYLYIPNSAEQNGKTISIGERVIFDATNSNNATNNRMKIVEYDPEVGPDLI